MKKTLLLILGLLIASCAKEEFVANKTTSSSTVNPIQNISSKICAQRTLIKPKVDLLFLWDNSTSTNFINTGTKTALNNIINNVSSNFDYRILLAPLLTNPTTNHSSLDDAKIILPSMPTGVDCSFYTNDAEKNYVGCNTLGSSLNSKVINKTQANLFFDNLPKYSGNYEAGGKRSVELLKNYISTNTENNNSIFRKGAYTIVVLMSNEDDNSFIPTNLAVYNFESYRKTYRDGIIKDLLCLRGNYDGVSFGTCPTGPKLDSSMLRFISIVPYTSCQSGYKNNLTYKDISKFIYAEKYVYPDLTNWKPTDQDDKSADVRDSNNICVEDYNHIFDGVNNAIQLTLLKHVYEYWPVTDNLAKIDLDTISAVRDDGHVLTRDDSLTAGATSGFKVLPGIQTQYTRSGIMDNGVFVSNPGEPFTGVLVQLFGSDKIVYPRCLTINYNPPKDFYGYVYMPLGKPLLDTVELRINGVKVPQDLLNGWEYLGFQSTSSLNPNLKIKYPDGLSPIPTSGYYLKLNGNAVFNNTSGPVNVSISYITAP